MSGFLLPDFNVSILNVENSMISSSLGAIRGNKAMVIDFWHTKCPWCPPALDKLNTVAGGAYGDDVVFISCALSQGDKDYEVASNLVCNGSHDRLSHVYMEAGLKESAKLAFKFKTVPHCVIVDKGGYVICSAQPLTIDFETQLAQATATVSTDAEVVLVVTNTFTLDEDF